MKKDEVINSVDLSQQFSDRSMGTRMQLVTRLTPEDGERALYVKGGEIALEIWANASTKKDDARSHEWIKEMQTILAGEPDVQIVFLEKRHPDHLPPALMIGDIAKGLEILSGSKITPYVASQLVQELEKAKDKKAELDAGSRSRSSSQKKKA